VPGLPFFLLPPAQQTAADWSYYSPEWNKVTPAPQAWSRERSEPSPVLRQRREIGQAGLREPAFAATSSFARTRGP